MTRRASSLPFLTMFLLLVIQPTKLWSVSFQPVVPEELKMTSEPKAPGAPAIILFREVNRDDRGKTAHEDVYFRIKILTEEGRKYGDIEIPFFRDSGKIVNIHARTIRPDGSVVDFTGKAFDKSIVKARGIRYMAKTFTMPDVLWPLFCDNRRLLKALPALAATVLKAWAAWDLRHGLLEKPLDVEQAFDQSG